MYLGTLRVPHYIFHETVGRSTKIADNYSAMVVANCCEFEKAVVTDGKLVTVVLFVLGNGCAVAVTVIGNPKGKVGTSGGILQRPFEGFLMKRKVRSYVYRKSQPWLARKVKR